MDGVKVTVSNRAYPNNNKTVTINNNVEIKNYYGDKMPENGFNAKIQDGQTTIIGSTSENAQNKLRSIDLASYKYSVFEKLINLDKNPQDLSEKDLDLASKSMDGVKQVKRDKEAGVTTLVFDNGEILRFDFETNQEKTERLKIEKEKSEKEEPEKKKPDQKIDCRSSLEKGIIAIINLFRD